MKTTTLLSISLLLCACVTKPQPESWNTEKATAPAVIKMVGYPTNLIVTVDGEYVGMTPMELVVSSHAERKWTKWTEIRASMPGNIGFDSRTYRSGDRVPERLLFNIPSLTPQEYQAVYGRPAPVVY